MIVLMDIDRISSHCIMLKMLYNVPQRSNVDGALYEIHFRKNKQQKEIVNIGRFYAIHFGLTLS